MNRLPVTHAVRLELNANDLSILHSSLVALAAAHLRETSESVPPEMFDLCRRLERGLTISPDCTREILQRAIMIRAEAETRNIERMKRQGAGDDRNGG